MIRILFNNKINDQDSLYPLVDQFNYYIFDEEDIINEKEYPGDFKNIKPTEKNRFGTFKVNVNYEPIYGFTYGSSKNMNGSGYSELQRKAYVRKGIYKKDDMIVENKMISPADYIKEVIGIYRRNDPATTWTEDALINFKENEYDVVEVFDEFSGDIQAPYIDIKKGYQEGLHRAIYAMRKGYPKIPVTFIK